MMALENIRDKLRYGLFGQSVLRQFSRAGFRVNPYLVYLERRSDDRPPDRSVAYSIDRICHDNLDAVLEGLPNRPIDPARWRERIDAGNLGLVLCDGEGILGCSWASVTQCRGIAVKPLFRLLDNQAYLFDMYVAERRRGAGLSRLLRCYMYEELSAMGRTEFYSLSMYFNGPANRFKMHLGAERLELRLSIDIFGWWQADVRLKRYAENLPTEWRAHPDRGSVI